MANIEQNNTPLRQSEEPEFSGRKRRKIPIIAKIIFLAIIIFPTVAVLYVFGYIPLKQSVYFSKIYTHTKNEAIPKSDITLSDKLTNLGLNEAYLNSRLKMSDTDSVCISINLPDHTLDMEIKGVVVRSCKITDYKISKGFSKIKQDQFLAWISAPFTLQSSISTILAAPVVHMKAPKDTIEANQKSQIPTLPVDTAVYYRLNFNRDLVVDINQKETPPSNGRKERFWYRFHNRYMSSVEAINAIFHPGKSTYRLWIEIELSREDARIIYRALPDNALMTLKITENDL
jgi:nitrate reductase NapE component